MITIEEIYKYDKELKNYLSKKYTFEKEDLEDIVSDTLLKCYEKIKLFNPNKSKLKTWIFNTAIRTLIDKHRQSKVKEKHDRRYTISNSIIETTLLDLQAFKEYLKDYPKMKSFFYFREAGYEEEEIMYYFDCTQVEYKEMLKQLNKLKQQFDNEN